MISSSMRQNDGESSTAVRNPFQASIEQRQSNVKSVQSLVEIFENRLEAASNISSTSSSFVMTFSREFYEFNDSPTSTGANDDTKKRSSVFTTIRSLKAKEISTLVQDCNCQSHNWNHVYIMTTPF